MRRLVLLLTLVLGFSPILRADVLRYKNGDTLKGTWERVQGGNLVFKSDSVGEITVPQEQIESFVTATPATALLPDGSTLDGSLEFTGKWEFVPASSAGAMPVATFIAIYPANSVARLEERIHPPLYRNWTGAANLGYSLITGDTQSRSLAASVNAMRKQPDVDGLPVRWRTSFSLTALFSHAQSSATAAEVSSKTFSGGLRQDRLFGHSNFIFALGQFDYIQPQGIQLRQTYGGGFGRDVVGKPSFKFSLLGGMTFVHTDFIAALPAEDSAEALAGESVMLRPAKFLVLQHSFNFYPNLTQTGEYRFDTNTTLSVPFRKRFSLSVSYLDFFLSNPQPGSHQNNSTFSTGLGLSF